MTITAKVAKVKPESILVYTPNYKMTKREIDFTYETLQRAACKALGYLPQSLPVGIILLKPGDKLEMLPKSFDNILSCDGMGGKDGCCGVLEWRSDGTVICNECGIEFDIKPIDWRMTS